VVTFLLDLEFFHLHDRPPNRAAVAGKAPNSGGESASSSSAAAPELRLTLEYRSRARKAATARERQRLTALADQPDHRADELYAKDRQGRLIESPAKAAPVGVKDVRLAVMRQRVFQCSNAERRVHRDRQPP
jgi:hypothetical protein